MAASGFQFKHVHVKYRTRYLDGGVERLEREINETIAVLNSTPRINAPGVRSRRLDRNVDVSSLSDTSSVYSDRSNDRNARRGSVGRVLKPNIQFTSKFSECGRSGNVQDYGYQKSYQTSNLRRDWLG